MDSYNPYPSDRTGGGVFGWALRRLLIWGAVIGVVYLAIGYGAQQLRQSRESIAGTASAPSRIADTTTAPQTAAAVQADGPVVLRGNGTIGTLSYRPDNRGHFWIDATVNGAPMRFLLDTGASYVGLTRNDAASAGFAKYQLDYTQRTNTANGQARVAPIKLREIRIGQLAIDDVPAVVGENLGVSLLGMSFLKRLHGYEIRDGVLTITW
jgi:aspartyl protease family protein